MEQKFTRKYGLLTAICMVVGTVIGSGIFFLNERIIGYTGGRIWIGIAAWAVGGLITLSVAYVFSLLATRYERVGGLVDYSEALLGERFGLLFGWFMAVIFYPSMSGILAWVAGRFTVVLFGWEVNEFFSAQTYMLALFYLMLIFSINALSPKLSGKFQVSTTFIKLVPLVSIGIAGTIVGILRGTTAANIASPYVFNPTSNPFFSALVATAFAYLGWDSILALNSEIKNSKRNLPIALVSGMVIIVSVYVLYTFGIFSSAPLPDLIPGVGVLNAFQGVFGGAAGSALYAFIVVSCLGALNGLTMGGQRAFYSLAARGKGFKPQLFSQIDPVTNASNNSAIIFVLLVSMWIIAHGGNFAGWYGDFNFDLMGFVPISFQTLLIPVYFWVIIKQKDFNFFNRFIAPGAAILGSLFLVYAIILRDGVRVLWYLGIFGIIMAIGAIALFRKKD